MNKTATLLLIKSKNPPVFETPLEICYKDRPEVGYPFLFSYRGFHLCNTSEVKQVVQFGGFSVIKTRNSYYMLKQLEK